MYFQDQNTEDNNASQQIDLNPEMALEKLDTWLDGFFKLLPNMVVAIFMMIAFYFIAKLIGRIIKNRFVNKDRSNLGEMLGSLVKYTVFAMGVMLAISVVVPSVQPGDIIAGLGVSSVAIGFAFKDILQNWLAGLLILIRQPFEIEDQIVLNDFEGTVEKIETRSTILMTYGGERIVIPNSDIYTNAVKVNTAYKSRRSQYDIGIGYGDNMEEAIEILKDAVSKVEGIDSEKEVEVLPWDLAASWVTLRVRWWTDSQRSSVVKTMVKVISTIKNSLDEARIDMPYDTQVHLFHDQTESTDGDRKVQREGWPRDKNDNDPTPKWQAEKEMTNQSKASEGSTKKSSNNISVKES